jgi:peptidoglycan hydrolase-like protein with peptidoglycan-binding domain
MSALFALALLCGVAAARTSGPASERKKPAVHSSRQSSKASRAASRKAGSRKQASRRRRNWRSRGQQAIQGDRARDIQAALIREHYLTGEPTGLWDDRTKQAMAKYQEDRGWQTKKLPDARALIELGLGPNHDGLLNPESVASTQQSSATPPSARPR